MKFSRFSVSTACGDLPIVREKLNENPVFKGLVSTSRGCIKSIYDNARTDSIQLRNEERTR